MLIRQKFFTYVKDKNYTLLPETALNSGKDIYFVMAPIGAYTEMFSFDRILYSTNSALTQRTLSCDRLQFTGNAPLANPSEVLAGYFRFDDPCLNRAVAEALAVLCDLLNTSPAAFFIRTTDQLDFRSELLAHGLPDDQIIVCTQPKQLSLGEDCPKGEYMFVYMQYRHGVIPVASIGILPYQGRFATDSAFFIERMTMITENVPYPTGSSLFCHLMQAVKAKPLGSVFDRADLHRWVYLARAATLCLRDGIYPSNAYAGHHVKRMLRMMAYAVRNVPVSPQDIVRTIKAAFEDCANLGYALTPEHAESIEQLFSEKVLQYKRQIQSALCTAAKLAEKKEITEEDAQILSSQYGLNKKWLLDYLKENGWAHTVAPEKDEYILGYAGYPYDDSHPVDLQALFKYARQKYSR